MFAQLDSLIEDVISKEHTHGGWYLVGRRRLSGIFCGTVDVGLFLRIAGWDMETLSVLHLGTNSMHIMIMGDI